MFNSNGSPPMSGHNSFNNSCSACQSTNTQTPNNFQNYNSRNNTSYHPAKDQIHNSSKVNASQYISSDAKHFKKQPNKLDQMQHNFNQVHNIYDPRFEGITSQNNSKNSQNNQVSSNNANQVSSSNPNQNSNSQNNDSSSSLSQLAPIFNALNGGNNPEIGKLLGALGSDGKNIDINKLLGALGSINNGGNSSANTLGTNDQANNTNMANSLGGLGNLLGGLGGSGGLGGNGGLGGLGNLLGGLGGNGGLGGLGNLLGGLGGSGSGMRKVNSASKPKLSKNKIRPSNIRSIKDLKKT